ncbi:ribosomal protein L2, carboxy-terminal domain protein [Medicago truncatula]|uniref:Ribosomal protein L2, carboxy-terminal domain protein n=1 Tax=Medicago truncatula TaxID=3880 RepID=G7JUD5_MEDTR|nr:ribosomal protein L2, carboxy-terminal domain protein [Medicago truncatula]
MVYGWVGGKHWSNSDNQHVFEPFPFDIFGFLASEVVNLLHRVQMVMPINVVTFMSKNTVFTRIDFTIQKSCTVWEGVLIDQKEESTSTDMPLGTAIHNIKITLEKGGQLARAAGAVAKLIAKERKSATLKLPSEEVRLISALSNLLKTYKITHYLIDNSHTI